MHPGLSVYATADGQHAVVVTEVTPSATDSSSGWEDIVPMGEVTHHLGKMPIDAQVRLPVAVPMAQAQALIRNKLSYDELMEAQRLGRVLAEDAQCLATSVPSIR
jgi:hypothetical protein